MVDVEATLKDLAEREEAREKELVEAEEGDQREGSDRSDDNDESAKVPNLHERERKTKKILVFDLVLAGKLFVYVAIPVSDTFTDLAYVCGARFYGVLFFSSLFSSSWCPTLLFVGIYIWWGCARNCCFLATP